MLQQQAKSRVRLYARLSKDDKDADKESNSIINQLQMGRLWAKENNSVIVGEYLDDGYSGTSFDRPDFNRLMKNAIDDPEPSSIWVKDMSRFGRNNAQLMYHVDEILPNNDILFIAQNDQIDTSEEYSILLPFKSLINEMYSRDQSVKVRSTKKAMALSGKNTSSFAAYGYMKDPQDKYQLLIDHEAHSIIKRMIVYLKKGGSLNQLAHMLCEEGVLIPRAHRAKKNGTLEQGKGFKHPTNWKAKTIKTILSNPVHLGHSVAHRTENKSFKNKTIVPVPESEWLIVRDTHEATMDQETFDLIQKIISIKKKPTKKGTTKLFTGLVKCPDCGRSLAYNNGGARGNSYLRCRTYVDNPSLCETHSITYASLCEIVLNDIQRQLESMKALGDDFTLKMRALSEKNANDNLSQIKKSLQTLTERSKEIDVMLIKLFEQHVLEKLTDERYEKMSITYEHEQNDIVTKVEALQQKMKSLENQSEKADSLLKVIRKYENITVLSREMLIELVDTIYVYHAEGKRNNRIQRVEINYRFINQSLCGIA